MRNETQVLSMPRIQDNAFCQSCSSSLKTNTISYRFRKFNIENMKPGESIISIGKRGVGKTTLGIDLASKFQKLIPTAMAVCQTNQAETEYKKYINSETIYKKYNSDILEKVFEKRNDLLLILDDFAGGPSVFRDRNFQRLFFDSQYERITTITNMNYALALPPNLRRQIDYIFIFREGNVRNRKRLYEFYAGMFPSFEVFSKVMDSFTSNYECLVIDNTVRSNNIEDIVFWYKAELHKEGDFFFEPTWKNSEDVRTVEIKEETDSKIDDDYDIVFIRED